MKKALLLIVIFVSVLIGCSSNDDEINVDPINCEFQPFLGTSGNVVQLNGNSVLLNGSITVTSTEPNCENPLILSQGFVYSTSIQPTIDNVVKEVDGETITEIINDLETETEYFVRTFLSTETETYYGNQISFIVENFFVGDVNLNSQNEVDDFGNNINNYSKIIGNLIIYSGGSSNPVVSLSALNKLTETTGHIRISNNNELTGLNGLENLTNIGEDISIIFNDSLINISALSGLTNLRGSLYVSSNNSLESLNGLNNLTVIEGDLGIGGASIVNLLPLSGLTNIGGDLIIDSSDILINLNGLENLTSIGGDLWIGYTSYPNSSLISLSGLENLISFDGSFKLINNPSLTDFCSLENLIISLINNGTEFGYSVYSNLYNPTLQDFLDGNCSI